VCHASEGSGACEKRRQQYNNQSQRQVTTHVRVCAVSARPGWGARSRLRVLAAAAAPPLLVAAHPTAWAAGAAAAGACGCGSAGRCGGRGLWTGSGCGAGWSGAHGRRRRACCGRAPDLPCPYDHAQGRDPCVLFSLHSRKDRRAQITASFLLPPSFPSLCRLTPAACYTNTLTSRGLLCPSVHHSPASESKQ